LRPSAAPALALGLLAPGLLAVACASGLPRPPAPAPAAPVPAPVDAAAAVEQRLYRLVYDGGEGRVGLRVVLRTTAGPRYQIAVSDVAGRRVWGLDYDSERTILVDHRERLFCVAGPDLRFTDVHPEELPLAALPRVLRGELPVEVPVEMPDAAGATTTGDDFQDAAGRLWRRQLADGVLHGWTLFDDGGPALWWTRQADGGILSRRGGEQYRWTEVVVEPAAGQLPDIVPAGFAEGTCSG
jgi:hypothetical protein